MERRQEWEKLEIKRRGLYGKATDQAARRRKCEIQKLFDLRTMKPFELLTLGYMNSSCL